MEALAKGLLQPSTPLHPVPELSLVLSQLSCWEGEEVPAKVAKQTHGVLWIVS